MARSQDVTAVLAESRAPEEWIPPALQEAVSAVGASRGVLELISEDGGVELGIVCVGVSAADRGWSSVWRAWFDVFSRARVQQG